MRLLINTSFALSAVSIPENDGGENEELFTIRRALAHVLTIIGEHHEEEAFQKSNLKKRASLEVCQP